MYYEHFINHPHFHDSSPPGGYTHFALGFVGKRRYFGYNKRKSNPNYIWTQIEGDPISTLHAEIDVLRQIPHAKIKNLKIYVTRIKKKKNGFSIHNSKPCPYCIDFMLKAGVKLKNIWYTNSSSEWVSLKNNYGELDAIKNKSQQSQAYKKAKGINLRKR